MCIVNNVFVDLIYFDANSRLAIANAIINNALYLEKDELLCITFLNYFMRTE